jgi:folate-binding protein YgfZ
MRPDDPAGQPHEMADSHPLNPQHHDRALAAARDAAVACDLTGLAMLAIAGADAAGFLQGQLSCDVRALPPGVCRYGTFNSPKGRMLANFVLWRRVPDGFGMLVAADIAEPVAKRLRMYVLRSKVTIADVSADTQRVGIGGPQAQSAVRAAFGVVPAPFAAREVQSPTVTLLALNGNRFVALAPASEADVLAPLSALIATGDFSVWRWLTIRAGTPVVTAATQDTFVAQAANLDVLGGIDFQKGCYTGQEIIARTQYLGRLKERAFLFHTEATRVAAGERIYSPAFEAQPCGTVVNAAPAPGGGADLLAVVQIAAAARDDARLRAPDGPLLVALPLPYEIPQPTAPSGRIA